MAAVIGRRAVMDYAQRTFISSAYWTERMGPSAALASLHKHRRENVGATLAAIGTRVQEGWKATAQRNGLTISVTGIPPLASFSVATDNPAAVTTLFIQE
ncbi:MAG: aminotransferase class III, partial [Candidatus Cloacimonetes bacterium]|nr:aminotransferase class III [Candidatus Cloacimonadota bacterium]